MFSVTELLKKASKLEIEALYPRPPPFDKDLLLAYADQHGYDLQVALDAVQFLGDLSPHLSKALRTGEFGLVRDDLYRTFFALLLESPSDRDLLDDFRGALTDDHLECLEVAMAANVLRDTGQDKDAQALIDDEVKRLGNDVRKINALHSAGLMGTVIRFQLDFERGFSAGGDPDARFRSWFIEQLKFFPKAIFVNQDWTEDRVWSELNARTVARQRPEPRVRIWAAGRHNITMVHKVLLKWIKENAEWDFTFDISPYGKAIGLRFSVFNKEKISLSPRRLPRDWYKEPGRLG